MNPTDCTLLLAARGEAELCPRERCPFWEQGGAVLDGECVIDRLGLEVRQREIAEYLLELRTSLEDARERHDADDLHRLLAQRIGLEL